MTNEIKNNFLSHKPLHWRKCSAAGNSLVPISLGGPKGTPLAQGFPTKITNPKVMIVGSLVSISSGGF